MKRLVSLSALALTAALALLSPLAAAAPVSFSFSGTVTGASAFNSDVLVDFPIGTPASFSVTFDSAPLTPTAPPPTNDVGPVSGQLALDTDVWQLDNGTIFSYQYQINTAAVDWYFLQFTGTGPSISNSGQLYGLLLQLTPDLQLFPGDSSIQVGFGYPAGNGTFYSYAYLGGRLSQVGRTPEPASLVLVGLGLVGLAFARRRRSP